MTKSILGIAMGLAMTTHAFAWGNTDHWERVGDTQHQNSAIVNKDGAYLQVYCVDRAVAVVRYADPRGVVVESETDNSILFLFDDDDMRPDALGISGSDFMGGERDLYNTLDALGRKHVVRVWGENGKGERITQVSTFTLKGSSRALPTNCNSVMEAASQ